jgi:hypothetical protein
MFDIINNCKEFFIQSKILRIKKILKYTKDIIHKSRDPAVKHLTADVICMLLRACRNLSIKRFAAG